MREQLEGLEGARMRALEVDEGELVDDEMVLGDRVVFVAELLGREGGRSAGERSERLGQWKWV